MIKDGDLVRLNGPCVCRIGIGFNMRIELDGDSAPQSDVRHQRKMKDLPPPYDTEGIFVVGLDLESGRNATCGGNSGASFSRSRGEARAIGDI